MNTEKQHHRASSATRNGFCSIRRLHSSDPLTSRMGVLACRPRCPRQKDNTLPGSMLADPTRVTGRRRLFCSPWPLNSCTASVALALPLLRPPTARGDDPGCWQGTSTYVRTPSQFTPTSAAKLLSHLTKLQIAPAHLSIHTPAPILIGGSMGACARSFPGPATPSAMWVNASLANLFHLSVMMMVV